VLVILSNSATLTLNAGVGGAVAGAGNYALGTDANLTATPSPGYVFTSWTGDLNSTDANATLTMNADKEVNANFVLATAILNLNAGGGGTVTGAGSYPIGVNVNLTATPSPGYVFSSWTGDLNFTDANVTVTMNADKDVNATFGPDTVDNDGDGLSNYREIVQLGSDPDDNDTDGDGLGDGTEDQWGLNPAVADTALMTFFANREATARAEGNTSGVAYAQSNAQSYGLFTESDRLARMTQAFDDGLAQGRKVGYARHLAESRFAFSKEGIELTATAEAGAPKPHTYDWYFQPGFGWVWTNQAIFPHLYLYDSVTGGGTWHYFDPYGNRSAPYYDQAVKTWKDIGE
jgi:uncharacterized repeat protein (TIGR02543 family)